jgi:hypothetical protein
MLHIEAIGKLLDLEVEPNIGHDAGERMKYLGYLP